MRRRSRSVYVRGRPERCCVIVEHRSEVVLIEVVTVDFGSCSASAIEACVWPADARPYMRCLISFENSELGARLTGKVANRTRRGIVGC